MSCSIRAFVTLQVLIPFGMDMREVSNLISGEVSSLRCLSFSLSVGCLVYVYSTGLYFAISILVL